MFSLFCTPRSKFSFHITRNGLSKKFYHIQLSNLRNKFLDQEQYIQKLQLLENQYFADIEKISEQIAGIKAINKYEYLYCPNCLRPISLHEESSCLLCHQNMDDIVIEINDLKKERKNLQKRKMSFTLILIQKKKKILE